MPGERKVPVTIIWDIREKDRGIFVKMIAALSESEVVLITTGCFCYPRSGAHVDPSPCFTGCLIGLADSSWSWPCVCKLWPHRAGVEGHRPVADSLAPALRSCLALGSSGWHGVGQGCEAGSPPSPGEGRLQGICSLTWKLQRV